MSRRKTYNLSKMSEDEVTQLMDSVSSAEDTGDESDDGDFDSEDDVADPDFISKEDELMIAQCILESNELSNGIYASINSSCLDDSMQSASSSHMASALISTSSSIPLEPIGSSTQIPSTSDVTTNSVSFSAQQQLQPPSRQIKRKREPNQILELQIEEDGPAPHISTSGEFSGEVNEMKNNCQEFKNIIWKKQNMQVHVNEVVFRGSAQLPNELEALKTPYKCFEFFLTEEFVQNLVDQSNLYARQKNLSTTFSTNAPEIRRFIGVLFYMSVYRYPNVRSYWSKNALPAVANTMTQKRFEEIRRFVHFNDDSLAKDAEQEGYDKLYKIRPLIDHFNNRFQRVPMLQRLCVDEMMCSTKMGGNPTRQYMPAKPHKWGTKLFVLCDSNGFSYAFEVYSGAGDNIVPDNAPDLGAASNVVIRLSAKVPNDINHIMYFDNFYTSLGLMAYLRSRRIYSLGTVRPNRVPNIKLSSDKELSKMNVKRGYSEEYVGNAYGIDISSVLWQDNKPVRLLSTYVGVLPFLSSHALNQPPQKSTRWDRKSKKDVDISCPYIIKEYNRHMGGVDLMDGLLGRYHIRMKTKKWTNRIFYHLLDVAITNAYILYQRLHKTNTRQKNIDLPTFRVEVAESLCQIGPKVSEGRPSSTLLEINSAQRVITTVYRPPPETRYDSFDHWCIFLDRSGKKQCKLTSCKSETQAFCSKCKLNLCNSTTKQCFIKFHKK